MEFGKLANIEKVDWKIPSDDPLSTQFLSMKATTQELKIYFGTPAWGHKSWIGKIYPPKTKAADFLFYYSRYFSCIELNTTHYRIPTSEQTKMWIKKVPPGFLFCPKILQAISHDGRGLQDPELLRAWFQFLHELSSFLGPSFIQFPPHFDYSMKAQLFSFLQKWPAEFPLALEFRHPSWFRDHKILPALTEYLQTKKIGLVITDVAGRRDVLHTSLSTDFSMLRFIGNELHPSDFTRATAWTERFKIWEERGLKKLFLFIHEPDDVSAPEMTNYFLKELDRIGNWKFEQPVLETQSSLLS